MADRNAMAQSDPLFWRIIRKHVLRWPNKDMAARKAQPELIEAGFVYSVTSIRRCMCRF